MGRHPVSTHAPAHVRIREIEDVCSLWAKICISNTGAVQLESHPAERANDDDGNELYKMAGGDKLKSKIGSLPATNALDHLRVLERDLEFAA